MPSSDGFFHPGVDGDEVLDAMVDAVIGEEHPIRSPALLIGSVHRSQANGAYCYTTSADGLCCYANKKDAVRNAARAGAAAVYSPSGKVVWTPYCRALTPKPPSR